MSGRAGVARTAAIARSGSIGIRWKRAVSSQAPLFKSLTEKSWHKPPVEGPRGGCFRNPRPQLQAEQERRLVEQLRLFRRRQARQD
ncbi:MAG: hypothetical protein AB7U20_05530, partial [Planctomycetaceae bacterium]